MSTFLKVIMAGFIVLPLGCTSTEGACERIVEACHDVDETSAKAHECHESAELTTATDESCAEDEDECIEACKP